MAIVEPGKGRAVIERSGMGLRITIPAPTQAFGLVFMSLWLVAWVVGEAFAIGKVASGEFYQNPETGLIIWFVVWTLGGGWIIYTLLWQLAGKEIIELNSTTLKQIRRVLLFNRSREFAVAKMANIRLAPPAPKYSNGKYMIQNPGFGSGAIAFDYGRDTQQLGQGLEEADARHVINEMRECVKSLSPGQEPVAS